MVWIKEIILIVALIDLIALATMIHKKEKNWALFLGILLPILMGIYILS